MKQDILLLGAIGVVAYFLLKGKTVSGQDTGSYGGGGGVPSGLSTPIFYIPAQGQTTIPQGSSPSTAQMLSGYPPGYVPTSSEAMANAMIQPGLGYVKFVQSPSGQWQGTSVFTPSGTSTYMPTAPVKSTTTTTTSSLKIPGTIDILTYFKK